MNTLDAIYDHEAKCAVLTFKGFQTTEQFIAIAEKAHVIRQQYNSNKQLNDIENMQVLTQDVQKYLQEKWFPKALGTGLKFFAFVVPKNVLGSLSMKNANKDADKTGIEIKYFDNLPDAKNWLKSK